MKLPMNVFILTLTAGAALASPNLSHAASAEGPKVLQDSPEYKDVISMRPYNESDREAFLADATLKMQTRGLYPISVQEKAYERAKGKEQSEPVDAVYATEGFHQMVFLKLGVEPKQKKLYGNLVNVADGYFYHDTTRTGIPFVAYFSAFSSMEATDALNDLASVAQTTTPNHGSVARFIGSLIPEAMAADCATPDTKPMSPSLLSQVGTMIDNNPVTACTANFFGQFILMGGLQYLGEGIIKKAGMTAMVGVNAYFLGQMIWNAKDSIHSIGKGFSQLRATYDSFDGDAAKIARHYIAGWDNLPKARQVAVLCGIGGAVSPWLLGKFGTGGNAEKAIVDAFHEEAKAQNIAFNGEAADGVKTATTGGGAARFTEGTPAAVPPHSTSAAKFEEGAVSKPAVVAPTVNAKEVDVFRSPAQEIEARDMATPVVAEKLAAAAHGGPAGHEALIDLTLAAKDPKTIVAALEHTQGVTPARIAEVRHEAAQIERIESEITPILLKHGEGELAGDASIVKMMDNAETNGMSPAEANKDLEEATVSCQKK